MTLPRAASHLIIGAAAWAAAFFLLVEGNRIAHAVSDGVSDAPASSPSQNPECAPSPAQTLREGEPPQVVGPRFDDDGALPTHAENVASYTLDARLDATLHAISGHGTIVWKNASTRPATELYFHLYLNAFKNNRTVFLRTPFGENRSGHGARHWGYIDVKRLSVREIGDADLWSVPGARSSEDPEDETDVRLALPKPVGPGETIHIDVEWASQLPEVVERTGYVGNFNMVGQWFPKLARREADGTWVHFPFNAESEFYADFGTYDVTLDVPKNMVVGATGVRVAETTAGDRAKLGYHADDVHDFAWTAWPGFLERRDTMNGVSVRVLYPRGNGGNAEATLTAVRHGLAFYGRLFGRYPYPVLTVVHPPENAPSAGGMEYPTLITTGAPWYASAISTMVERVTLHELGHQWFYGLVATDEHSWPFLDEGLTTYAESASMRALFGAGNGLRAPGLTVDGDAYLRAVAASAGHDDVVARPAAAFANFGELGALVYARTGTILETAARLWGEAGLRRALGRYARRYRFDHPGPKHLVAVVREVMGDEPADFLEKALFAGGTVDFVAKDLETSRTRPRAGVFDSGSHRETLNAPDTNAPSRFVGQVLVYRHGTLRVPVDVELRFEDGSIQTKRWDGTGPFRVIDVEAGSPLVAAFADPNLAVVLDDNLSNNGISTAPSNRLSERATYFAELALGAFGP